MNDPGSHGLCGDPKQLSPEPASIAEMKYMEAADPQRIYTAGSIVEFTIHVSTHHMGHFEFRICDRVLDRSLASAEEGQQCLNRHVLKRAPRQSDCGQNFAGDCQPLNPNYPERWYLPPPGEGTDVAGEGWSDTEASTFVQHGEVYSMRYVIPEDLSCEHCTLQWYYATGNSCAYDEDYFIFDPGWKFFFAYGSSWGTCANSCCGAAGSGNFGEEFWNCADVRITGAVPIEPPTSVPTPAPGTTSLTEARSSSAITSTTIDATTALPTAAPTSPAATTTLTQTRTQAPPTVLPTTTLAVISAPQQGIRSGDTIFLQTHSGEGNMLHVEGTSVGAQWQDRGDWQAFIIERNGGGLIRSGNTVFLTAHTGAQVDVEGEAVQARWPEKGAWQELAVEKADGNGIIFPGDVVCFRSRSTRKHIDVESDTARARWVDRCGFWQGMRVELKQESVAINSGDDVYLKSHHTGKFIEVEGDSVGARWNDQGLWQRLRIESENGGAVNSGDTVFLIAHTSKMLEVQSSIVRARYTDRGNWQKFVIRSEAGGTIHASEVIFLVAHTGNLVDVEDAAVSARWGEQGLWQSLSLVKHSGRALQQTSRALSNLNDTDDVRFGTALGVVSGLFGTAFLTAVICTFVGKLRRWQLVTKVSEATCPTIERPLAGGKVHPSTGNDDGESD